MKFPRSLRAVELVLLVLPAASACLADPSALPDDSESIDGPPFTIFDLPLPTVPGPAVPAGYGRYCSVVDDSNGGWAFTWSDGNGDPCATLRAISGPKTTVKRAGLWNMNGNNNAMVQCAGNITYYGRSWGSASLDNIFHNPPPGAASCVFTISPTKLPIWGSVFPAGTPISGASVYDYDWRDEPWNVATFGKLGTGNACAVDRTGFEANTCGTAAFPGNPNAAFEAAYDYSVARDTPLLAVADGIVRGSVQRTVWPMCETWPDGVPKQSQPWSPQMELFVETQVGASHYAEHFVAAYHHMDLNPNTVTRAMNANWVKWGGSWLPPVGTVVHRGDVIGYVGESGCSNGGIEGAHSYHLDLSVIRLTNLFGARAYTFKTLVTQYDANNNSTFGAAGVNGAQGVIDPFGWAAPANVDPAVKYLGEADPYNPPANVTQDGAWSIALFDGTVNLPHNGGAAW